MRKSKSGSVFLCSLGLTTGLVLTSGVTPVLLSPAPAIAQPAASFADVQGHWAQDYIQALAARGIISGFPDGSFRPSQPVTRAQFAAIVTKAFNASTERRAASFTDVSRSYWAWSAIREAYQIGFMSGYPDGRFQPEQNIPRVQVLVALANGLGLTRNAAGDNLSVYRDADQIPDYARASVVAATENRIVVNYPNRADLNPNQYATRADVAAFVYQSLVSGGRLQAINSPYVVGGSRRAERADQPGDQGPIEVRTSRVQAGAKLQVRYAGAQRILVAPNETVPLTLTIADDVRGLGGQVVIPQGSQVSGQLRPAQGGSQFVARQLQLPTGQRYRLEANSAIVRDVKDPRDTSVLAIVQDAAIGSAAAAILSGTVVPGRRITPERVLGGAAAGVLVGNVTADRVVVIQPDQDLDLTLRSDLILR